MPTVNELLDVVLVSPVFLFARTCAAIDRGLEGSKEGKREAPRWPGTLTP